MTPPLIALSNSKLGAVGQRLDLDVAVAELPAPAGLLLVAPVRLGRPADRLLIGDARRLEGDLGPEARLQPVDHDLDVDLRQPGDDLVAGLRVAVQVDRRVLLLQAAQRGEDLVLVALGLGLDREGHDRLGQRQRGHRDRLVAGGQPIAGARLLELGHGADVARPEGVRVALLAALGHDQRPDALLGVRAGVEHLGVGPHNALVDAEEVDPSGELIGLRLEHEGEQLLVLVGLEGDLGQLEGAVLDRAREVLDDRVEQAVGAEVLGRHAAHHREDPAVVGAVLQRGDDLLVGDLLALEIALHERVGDLGDLVHELLAVLLRLGLELVGDRDLARVVASVAVVFVGLHVDEVHDAADLVLGADRDLRGHHVGAEGGLQRLEGAEEVGALAVEHVDEEHPRQVELLGALPQADRVDLGAHDRVDHEDGRFADPQGAERVGDEAGLARGVDEVDLALVPVERAQRRADRHLARLLVGVGIGGRVAIQDRAQPVDGAGLEQQRLVDRGLPAAAMADKGDVPDAVRPVHALSPLLESTEATDPSDNRNDCPSARRVDI